MNTRLLVCDPRYFRIDYEINPYMHTETQPDLAVATAEHEAIVAAHLAAGRKVEYVAAVPGCPDMVYTANAAVVRGDRVVLASLPPERQAETPHHRAWFVERDYRIVEAEHPFSGQGDALACGDLLFAGYGQRTDRRVLRTLADFLDYRVIPLRTVSARWYDLDLALAVINTDTVAYCPEAFDRESQLELAQAGLDLVEVSRVEADNFALNLISDGTTVTMTTGAPVLAAELGKRGLTVVELETAELRKGGGGIRCTALTLDNA
jgi:N-dimethylarginine dimethylaminohydrolase